MNTSQDPPDEDIEFDTDADMASQDSGILQGGAVPDDFGPFKIYARGALTVVGFGGQPVPDLLCLTRYHDALEKLFAEVHCQILAVDLSGVVLIPSGLLGLLTSFRKSGIEVQLHNTSPDIKEVLEMTKLNSLIHVSS
ncbi:MAG: STAS domain-containing protein [Planctomycetaceae bacterium]